MRQERQHESLDADGCDRSGSRPGRYRRQARVVGKREAGKCEIVTSNPVVTGDTWFADGPYKTSDDAKLAPECPPVKDEPADK